jgi:hypothetical protein
MSVMLAEESFSKRYRQAEKEWRIQNPEFRIKTQRLEYAGFSDSEFLGFLAWSYIQELSLSALGF